MLTWATRANVDNEAAAVARKANQLFKHLQDVAKTVEVQDGEENDGGSELPGSEDVVEDTGEFIDAVEAQGEGDGSSHHIQDVDDELQQDLDEDAMEGTQFSGGNWSIRTVRLQCE